MPFNEFKQLSKILGLLEKHYLTIIKIILFVYILYAFTTGVENLTELISLLIAAGLILIPSKDDSSR
jgi:hypothetical protein